MKSGKEQTYSERQYSINDVSRKIGIKLLDESQIASTLINYDQLLKNIDYIRDRAQQHAEWSTPQHCPGNMDNHLMYDNIIGIFGGRGSGKTSILYSLRERLMWDQAQDIILPIISPELIPEENTLLMWILAMFEEWVNELDLFLSNRPDILNKAQEILWNLAPDAPCTFRQLKADQRFSLRQEYQRLRQNCGSDRGFRGMRGYDYDDMLQLQNINATTQYQLMQRLNRFWDLIAYLRHMQDPQAPRPLIFVIIDDIDLAPERSMELLLSAYKYFSNPNVVIILSAAMKTLQQVLTCRMYEKVVGSNFRSLIQGNELIGHRHGISMEAYHLNQANEAALEYLNKVIPQSSRYFIERFDTLDRKQLFRYPVDWVDGYHPGENHSLSLACFLSDGLEKSGLLTAYYPYADRTAPNFFLQDDKSFSIEYYLLFGNKSRYIGNSCLSILSSMEVLAQIKKQLSEACKHIEKLGRNREEYLISIYSVVNNLFITLLSSHTREMEDCTDWVPELFLYKYGRHYLYIHYTHLLEIYRKKSRQIKVQIMKELANSNVRQEMDAQELDKWKNDRIRDALRAIRQKTSALFIMLNFLEQLICLLAPYYYLLKGEEGRFRTVHGQLQLMDFLNQDALTADADSNMLLFPQLKDAKTTFRVYADLMAQPERFVSFSIWNPSHVADYFSFLSSKPDLWNMLCVDKTGSDVPRVIVACREYPNWMRTVGAMLYLSKSGVMIPDSSWFSWFISFSSTLSVFPGIHDAELICKRSIQSYMKAWNLQSQSEEHELRLKSLYQTVSEDPHSIVINNWRDFCVAFSTINNSHDSVHTLIYAYLKKANLETTLQDNYNFTVTQLMFILQRDCMQLLPTLPLSFYIPQKNMEEVNETLTLYSDIMELPDSLISPILLALHAKDNIDNEDGCTLPFFPMYLFLRSIKEKINNRSVMEETISAFALERIFHIASLMEMRIIVGQEEQASQALSEILALFALLPYYFSALFSEKNKTQYTEFRIYSEAEAGKERNGRVDLVAQKYAEFLKVAIQEDEEENNQEENNQEEDTQEEDTQKEDTQEEDTQEENNQEENNQEEKTIKEADYDLLHRILQDTRTAYLDQIFSKLGVK